MSLWALVVNLEHRVERWLGLAGTPPDLPAGTGTRMSDLDPTASAESCPPTLSGVRRRVLEAVASVVPSAYPSERWHALAPSYDPAHLPVPGYSTCGELPRFAGATVGVNTRGGLASIRDLGKKVGAWVEGGGDRRPCPADFYLVGNAKGEILHTGIVKSRVVNADGSETWETADAGQGHHTATDPQRAAYVTRTYDPAAGTLTGSSGPRVLVGWLDVEKAAAAAGGKGVA